MFSKKVVCFMLLSSLFGPSLFAGTERGGGDEIGLAFQATAAQAITRLQAGDLPSQAELQLRTILDQARYLVVDQALYASLGGDLQDAQASVALNDPAKKTVYINRDRWNALKDPILRQSIALHELLSLIGIESTGDYHLSSAVAVRGGDEELPEAHLLHSRFFDDKPIGLNADSVNRSCILQKGIYRSQYRIVYCSFLEKKIPHYEKGKRHPVSYETAYGLKVWGVGKAQQSGDWKVVFSGDELKYPTEAEAIEACSIVLAESISSEPLWTGARCFAVQDGFGKFSYEIRLPR